MKFFLHSGFPSGTLHTKKFQERLILVFEANGALSRENETKIVKITHSVLYSPVASKTSWGWNRAVVQKKWQRPFLIKTIRCGKLEN